MICRMIANGRILFMLAGTMTALTVVLTALVSPWFLLLGVLVAANQLPFAAVGACPASLVLSRVPCPARAAR